jgi:hypothetical protein
MNIFILDEIVVKPGCAEDYRRAYAARYAPGAERRGMSLAGAWQTPPGQDFAEVPTTLFYLWTVDGVAGWWNQRMSKLPDGSEERFEKLCWWQESEKFTISRKRRMLSDQPEAG